MFSGHSITDRDEEDAWVSEVHTKLITTSTVKIHTWNEWTAGRKVDKRVRVTCFPTGSDEYFNGYGFYNL